MGRLIDQFRDLSEDQHASGWSELWENDEIDLWDRGGPSPSLVDLFEDHRELLSAQAADGGRKLFFVPACGRGFDVVLGALNGFDTVGLEISELASSRARETVSSELSDPSDKYVSPPADRLNQRPAEQGNTKIIVGDFFERDWESVFSGHFPDIVYDYTFLCALPPSLRRRWAQRMEELIPSGGHLICLEFPLFKGNAEEGPPWGLNGVYWDLLACGGDGLEPPTMPEGQEQKNGQFEQILRLKPERQLPQGRGTDMIGVWKRK